MLVTLVTSNTYQDKWWLRKVSWYAENTPSKKLLRSQMSPVLINVTFVHKCHLILFTNVHFVHTCHPHPIRKCHSCSQIYLTPPCSQRSPYPFTNVTPVFIFRSCPKVLIKKLILIILIEFRSCLRLCRLCQLISSGI